MAGNVIGDEGGVEFAAALMNPDCGLKELSLKNNNIKNDSAEVLTKAVKVNHNLTSVNILMNNVNFSLVRAINKDTEANREQRFRRTCPAFKAEKERMKNAGVELRELWEDIESAKKEKGREQSGLGEKQEELDVVINEESQKTQVLQL